MRWTYKDNLRCYKEGWAPFQIDTSKRVFYSILRLDDPDGVAKDQGQEPFKGQRFASDEAARRFVRARAKQGNRLAIKALALCRNSRKGTGYNKALDEVNIVPQPTMPIHKVVVNGIVMVHGPGHLTKAQSKEWVKIYRDLNPELPKEAIFIKNFYR
jgi:hypothetical protein